MAAVLIAAMVGKVILVCGAFLTLLTLSAVWDFFRNILK